MVSDDVEASLKDEVIEFYKELGVAGNHITRLKKNPLALYKPDPDKIDVYLLIVDQKGSSSVFVKREYILEELKRPEEGEVSVEFCEIKESPLVVPEFLQRLRIDRDLYKEVLRSGSWKGGLCNKDQTIKYELEISDSTGGYLIDVKSVRHKAESEKDADIIIHNPCHASLEEKEKKSREDELIEMSRPKEAGPAPEETEKEE